MDTVTEPSPEVAPAMSFRQRIALALIVLGLVASVLVLVLLAVWQLPTGIAGQWEWPWRSDDLSCHPVVRLVPFMALIPLLILLRSLARPSVSRRLAAGLIAACCLGTGANVLLLQMREPLPVLHVAESTASAMTTGSFSYATALSGLGPVLRAMSGRPEQAPYMPIRVATHPPGPVVYYYLGLRLFDHLPGLTSAVERWVASYEGLTPHIFHRTARWHAMPSLKAEHMAPAFVLGLLLTLLGALLPVPVYFAAKALHGPRTGLVAAWCTMLLPSLTGFIPSIDGWGAVLAVTPVALWLVALRDRRPWLYALAGLGMAAAVFWSVGLIAVAVAMAAAAVPSWRDRQQRRQSVAGVALALGAFAVVWLVMYVATGYNLPYNIREMLHNQAGEMGFYERSYWAWLPGNLWEIVLFMGPALLGAALAVLPMLPRLPVTARHFAAGAFLALGLVWLSGSTLGEVGRIWLFLMALLMPGAAMALTELDGRPLRPLLVLLALSQTLLMVMLHCRLVLVHP